MNFYDFHIGDYASRTAHLEPMEDLAYRRMLDLYYTREEALPLDAGDVARLVRLRGQEGVIQAVLDEFFAKTDAGWTHGKCEEVIAAAADKRAKARAAAQLSVEARAKAAGERTLNGRSADVEPTLSGRLAPSPSPSPTTQEKKTGAFALLLLSTKGIPEDLARDFLAIRRAKKSPLTMTALAGIEREAAGAGFTLEAALRECCARGWQGFKAEWVQTKADVARQNVPGPTAYTPPKPLSPTELAANKAKADQVAASLGIPNMKVKH